MKKTTLLCFFISFSCAIFSQRNEELSTKAAQGDARSQFLLGYRLLTGEGVEKNPERAFHWFYEAAIQNHPDAQNYLGLCYSQGIGTNKDLQKALEYFSQSAANENAWGEFNLATCYYYGDGTPIDYPKAFYYFRKSAIKGNASAWTKMGECYLNGQGVQQDFNNAMKCFQNGSDGNDELSQFQIGLMYYEGKGVKRDYSKALEWFSKASNKNNTGSGHPWAEYYVGLCHKNGFGTKQNLTIAFNFFKKSAQKNYDLAQYELALCNENGEGTEIDFKEAYFWYKEAQKQDNEDAIRELKKYHFFSVFVPFYAQKKYGKSVVVTDSIKDEARKVFIETKKSYLPLDPFMIGNYDMNLKGFKGYSEQLDSFFLAIPREISKDFKLNWRKKFDIVPSYNIQDDDIYISEVGFIYKNNKRIRFYSTPIKKVYFDLEKIIEVISSKD